MVNTVDRLTDDSWFEFLDEIDYVEKYGEPCMYVCVSTVGATTVFILGLITVYTLEDVMFNLSHFYVHTCAFGFLFAVALGVLFWFPVPQTKGSFIHDKSKSLKSFKVIFRDVRTVLTIMTVIFCGFWFACFRDYRLWYMEDLGADGYILCTAVAVGLASEIPVYLLYKNIIKKLTVNGSLSFTILSYSMMFFLISFVPSPWGIVSMHLLEGISNALMWRAVFSFIDHISNPGMDRHVTTVFYALHGCVGQTSGALFGGFLYNYVGPVRMFQVGGTGAVIWSFLFFVSQHYLPTLQRRTYSKILFGELRNQREDKGFYRALTSDSDEEFLDSR
ncbi:major facilitator superfamily domain-containing protein 6-like protein B [Tachypleus tridentatus]|uniref:major facilitator superfamily domain-containing protein 6-like protein B n=1 Tax=Tachypleus tridentatus TaxID=6853 RepID=UPI003FD607E8